MQWEDLSAPDKVLQLAKSRRRIHRTDVLEFCLHTKHLTNLVNQGHLVRVARGWYRPTQLTITHLERIADAVLLAKGQRLYAKDARISLLSALYFHGLIEEEPDQVWMAIPHGHHL